MRYGLESFYSKTKQEAGQGLKKYFEPLIKYPKTIIGISLIIAGFSVAYDESQKVQNILETQTNTGLEKVIEINKK